MSKKKKKKKQLEGLKMFGQKSEAHLNKLIHKWLDDPDIINLIKLGAKQHIRLMKLVREYADVLATQLNIPTKDDVRNVAQLAIQIEEKLDDLEDKMLTISKKAMPGSCQKKNSDSKEGEKERLRKILIENIMVNQSGNNALAMNKLLESLMDRRR
ncbi:hypothetical protein [Alkalihalobacillus deserti]|uniref:hypothetical protein n=1 Tax=Alkalihalobacillus deserti TaxID=2879466 RepID=UPI001D1525D5|nr:hypothetical protein [Alkalihalobacillus deserti]